MHTIKQIKGSNSYLYESKLGVSIYTGGVWHRPLFSSSYKTYHNVSRLWSTSLPKVDEIRPISIKQRIMQAY